MANICSVVYHCISDSKQPLKELFDFLEKNKQDDKLGSINYLTRSLGITDMACRGEVTDYLQDEDYKLCIYMDTAWRECEDFRRAIEQHWPDIKVLYREEEPGMDIFFTNSYEEFPDKYRIDMNGDIIYLPTKEKIVEYINYVNDVYNDINITNDMSIEDIKDEIVEHIPDDEYFNINMFELLDD